MCESLPLKSSKLTSAALGGVSVALSAVSVLCIFSSSMSDTSSIFVSEFFPSGDCSAELLLTVSFVSPFKSKMTISSP